MLSTCWRLINPLKTCWMYSIGTSFCWWIPSFPSNLCSICVLGGPFTFHLRSGRTIYVPFTFHLCSIYVPFVFHLCSTYITRALFTILAILVKSRAPGEKGCRFSKTFAPGGLPRLVKACKIQHLENRVSFFKNFCTRRAAQARKGS